MEAVKCARSKTTSKTIREFYVFDRYDVLIIANEHKLIIPMKNSSKPVIFFGNGNELYAILREIHLQIGHGSRNRMMATLNEKYKNTSSITAETVAIFLNRCEVCQKKSKALKKGVVVRPVVFS